MTWRVIKRDQENDDPALIRHLHDLGALHRIILAEPKQFVETAQAAFAIDRQSGPRRLEHDLPAAARQALEILNTDSAYADEYQQFVMNMSYAKEGEAIAFIEALDVLDQLISLI